MSCAAARDRIHSGEQGYGVTPHDRMIDAAGFLCGPVIYRHPMDRDAIELLEMLQDERLKGHNGHARGAQLALRNVVGELAPGTADALRIHNRTLEATSVLVH